MAADSSPLILVVEDDPGIAVLERRRLERAGYRVDVANDVESALAVLARGMVRLVVLDYRLGETTGLDLHRRMRANGIELPVILVSGSMEDTTVLEALRAGVRDIVVKTPDYLDHLPDAVRGVLSQITARPGPVSAPSTSVLVVEDDPGTAALERRHLERAGYSVKLASTGEEALAAAAAGDIAVAVIDLRLPNGVSGLDVYERLKKSQGRPLPAILVTGFPDQAVAIQALRAGIRDFVPKSPDFLEYLPTAVGRVLSDVRVERKLAESELRMASIIGTTMDAILMSDAQARIVLFNRSAELLFRRASAQAIGAPMTDFIPTLRLRAPAPGEPPLGERLELDAVRADGAIVPVEVSVTDVDIHGERLYTVIARDISERRRAEAELREADRRKDEFLGMLAHELRNPLAAVMTAGEVLHRTVGDSSPAQKLTGVIRRQTRALSRMVDDLLDVSRVTLGKIQLNREPLVLGEAAGRAAEAIRDTAREAGLQLDVQIGNEPARVKGDPTRLEQVVTNLLTNAVKFTPSGGRVTLVVGTDGNDAVVRVSDTGIGIAPNLLPRVFDLFVQGDTSLDRSRSGLGIGLALVRQIVTLHGGAVTASSDGPGSGSEFIVRLPMTRDELVPADDADARDRAERSLRVLVVDDQTDIADSLAMLVQSLGHTAIAAYDGTSALALSREHAPDAVFVDIGMPQMTGYELARTVREDPALAHLKLVALTGYGREEDRARARDAGFDLHLTKPVTEDDVHAALESVVPGAR